MNTRRLRMLADHLMTVPEDQFQMDRWGFNTEGRADFSCNTSACAVGWGTTHPILSQEGLRLDWGFNDDYAHAELDIRVDGQRYHDEPEGLRVFFGLGVEDVDQLFFGDQMTPIEKAKQIHTLCDAWDHRQLLKEKSRYSFAPAR